MLVTGNHILCILLLQADENSTSIFCLKTVYISVTQTRIRRYKRRFGLSIHCNSQTTSLEGLTNIKKKTQTSCLQAKLRI
jgi:hypothetical protein